MCVNRRARICNAGSEEAQEGKQIEQVEQEAEQVEQEAKQEDKNANVTRSAAKLQWKRFHTALKRNLNPDVTGAWDQLAISRNRKLQTKFMEAWGKDPEWGFVQVFKSSFMRKTDDSVVAKGWLTAKEMKHKYGNRARSVMAKKMVTPGQSKVDDDDGEVRYCCKLEEKDVKVISNIKEKGVEQKCEDTPLPPPLAIADAPIEHDEQGGCLTCQSQTIRTWTSQSKTFRTTAVNNSSKHLFRRWCSRSRS